MACRYLYTCRRCKRELATSTRISPLGWTTLKSTYVNDAGQNVNHDHDLCGHCLLAYLRFLANAEDVDA